MTKSQPICQKLKSARTRTHLRMTKMIHKDGSHLMFQLSLSHEPVMKEEKSQVKAGVGIEAPWRTFAKEMSFAFPKMASNIVRSVEVLEGDGGLGTVYLINLGSDKSQFQFYIFSEKSSLGFQEEKVAVFNESLHQIGFQVIEGGYLNHGFTSYTTVLRFNAAGESETIVDVKVL
ncbi:phytohormone-binding protein-like isoform X2 [Coffea arabica]|uniref:Phytohormone-binding protein-like isoform X2 n=1 Tax=Coffea arabica TaxID=13443 RepID=A0ABM4X6M0_COFAR